MKRRLVTDCHLVFESCCCHYSVSYSQVNVASLKFEYFVFQYFG